jgi:hypothetical protein
MATNPKLEEIANALMRNKTTSMIAPNEYTDRTRSGQANIDRRNKMIELLQGQANAPIERFGYGGIEAVTPPAAYLGKILSGVMAQYQSGKAGQEQEALDKYKEQAQTQDMKTMIEMMNKGTGPTDVSSVNDTSYIKDPARREQQDKFLAEPIMPQQPTYTGGMPEGTVSTGKPIMPVTEIQERRYSMRTPEGQAELLRQTASDKQSRAEMLARQLEMEEDARIRDETQDRQDIRADNRDIALVKAAGERRASDEFKANNKPVPLLHLSARLDNKTQLDVIREAYEAVDKNPDAFGAKNYLGSDITQRVDPEGIDPRDKVGKINAIQLHDLSGAAVNASEAPRFTPFLPSPTDTPEKIKTNLKNMYHEILKLEQERGLMFSDGFAPTLKPLDDYVNYSFDKPKDPAATKMPVGNEVPEIAVGTIKEGYRFKGGDPSNENNWAKTP